MSLAAPGTTVTVTSAASPTAPATSTGTWFVAGMSLRGPVGTPVALTSMSDFATLLGSRQSYSPAWDSCELAFASGVSTIWFSRYVGPAATVATFPILDSSVGQTAKPTVTVSALGAGIDGNNISVQVIAGPTSGTLQLQVFYSGVLVETSPALATVSDFVNWGTPGSPMSIGLNVSKWVKITNAGSTNANPAPAVMTAPAPLSGGADDNVNAGDTQLAAALTAFPANLGPGQVSAPGRTTAATYVALGTHGAQFNRLAVCDAALGATAATIASAAQTAQTSLANAGVDPSYTTFVAAWLVWPGYPTGTAVPAWNRQVPGSAGFAALCARSDIVNDCNVAAAGANGILPGAPGITTVFSDADRATLDAAGVCVFRFLRNQVVLYGFQSLASDPAWQDLANVRFRMQLTDDFKAAGDAFDYAQIDGAGKVISAFNGAITARCSFYYNKGSLFGATPSQAFSVDTSAAVNTPSTIASRQLRAVVSVAMSPSARNVVIPIVKYPAGQSVPALIS